MLGHASNYGLPVKVLRILIVIFVSNIVACYGGDKSLTCEEIEKRKAKRNSNKFGVFVKVGWPHYTRNVEIGGKIQMHCDHIGYREGDPAYSPNVELHWFKESYEIVPDDRIKILGCNKSPFISGTKLLVANARQQDAGEYSCKLWLKGTFPEKSPLVVEKINLTIRNWRIGAEVTRERHPPVGPMPYFVLSGILAMVMILICCCAYRSDGIKKAFHSCKTGLHRKLLALKPRKVENGYSIPVTFQTNENTSLVDCHDEKTSVDVDKVTRTFSSVFPFLTSEDIRDLMKYEIQRERLQCNMQHSMPIVLGTGNFGQVYAGRIITMKGTITSVAVKKLNDGYSADDIGDFLREVVTLMRAGIHINVISLVGTIVLDTLDDTATDPTVIKVQRPPILLMELANGGNLRKYLQDNRGNFSHMNSNHCNWNLPGEKTPTLTMQMLVSFAYQVAQGMEHLSLRKILHRDLAARNILLTDQLVVKIADFGLSKFMSTDKEYYRVTNQGITPAKWTAPESLWTSKFSVKSDVWSYGVLLWEILTLGEQPYVTIPACRLYEYLAEGNRLKRPNLATFELHESMLACWAWEPELRPDFSNLVKDMGDIVMSLSKRVTGFDSRQSFFCDSERDSGMSFCTSSITDSFCSPSDINYSSTSFGSSPSMETVIATLPRQPDGDMGSSALYEIMNPLYEPHSSDEQTPSKTDVTPQ